MLAVVKLVLPGVDVLVTTFVLVFVSGPIVAVVRISELKMNSKETVTMSTLLRPSRNRWLSATRRRTLFLTTKTTPRCDEVHNLKSALSSKRADGLAEGAMRCRKLV